MSGKDTLLELIRKTSSELPKDIKDVLLASIEKEEEGSRAKSALLTIKDNLELAEKNSAPICQDTGMIKFYVECPKGFDTVEFKKLAEAAVDEATAKGYLRQNSVDSITGKNTGNNLGKGTPQYHFEQWDKEDVQVYLILKGGGCENVGIQYSLPCQLPEFNNYRAGRDVEGVKAAILHGIWKAQGKGCAPGYIGVCIGSDRAHGLEVAKEQLLRVETDTNPDGTLAKLEKEIFEKANSSQIGPMGFGGETTVLGVKITDRNRLPASFFVSIAYGCWAHRRRGILMDNTYNIKDCVC